MAVDAPRKDPAEAMDSGGVQASKPGGVPADKPWDNAATSWPHTEDDAQIWETGTDDTHPTMGRMEAYWDDNAVDNSSPDRGSGASNGVADNDDGSADGAHGNKLADNGRWPLTMKETPHWSASPRRSGARADVVHDALAAMEAWVGALGGEH